ncbi:MAG: hydroxymethylbilane synthase [Dissulfurimicrobium sp.]|uniref:hydroxymethylbilane synthase n=1 Tax=Dissulfurimicrobium TaxID=1769732 RepID=UPI001EDB2C2F|nr:hydroxymethylbilane synthase [Dissulfurimicrobium hydrothermale]UKL14641.1 hydroxymethylbilane synthase [Dissulfurimicrobium hydrothermale]
MTLNRLTLRLGTRKSVLALTQSTWVKNRIEALRPDVTIELVKITTKGDKILDVPLSRVGGKGLFVKEIEEALFEKKIDFAVHSLKDVPAELPNGLEVSIFPKREDIRDAFISKTGLPIDRLPEGAKVGTSSLRRMAQLRAIRPDLNIVSLRGNLDTRLRKLAEGEFDAIVLASAGLKRLGLEKKITHYMHPEVMFPAVGQGALGLEFRGDDARIRDILNCIHHEETAICIKAERSFLARLEGGCQVPIGAFAEIGGAGIILHGLIGDEAGKRIIKMTKEAGRDEAEWLGYTLGGEMLAAGGAEILRETYAR